MNRIAIGRLLSFKTGSGVPASHDAIRGWKSQEVKYLYKNDIVMTVENYLHEGQFPIVKCLSKYGFVYVHLCHLRSDWAKRLA